jgi:VanZ family protein
MPPIVPARPLNRAAAALFLVLLAVIVWGSFASVETPGGGRYDKLEHFAAYGLLAVTGFLARGRSSLTLLAGLAALGAGIEALQATLTAGRQGSAWDLLANLGGLALAWVATALLRR